MNADPAARSAGTPSLESVRYRLPSKFSLLENGSSAHADCESIRRMKGFAHRFGSQRVSGIPITLLAHRLQTKKASLKRFKYWIVIGGISS